MHLVRSAVAVAKDKIINTNALWTFKTLLTFFALFWPSLPIQEETKKNCLIWCAFPGKLYNATNYQLYILVGISSQIGSHCLCFVCIFQLFRLVILLLHLFIGIFFYPTYIECFDIDKWSGRLSWWVWEYFFIG